MMRHERILLWLVIALGMLATGCAPEVVTDDQQAIAVSLKSVARPPVPRLLNKYQTGQVDTVHWSRLETYDTWVEMPDEEPTQKKGRHINIEMILTCEVQGVDDDGAALTKVTIEKASMHMVTRKSEDEEVIYDYTSTAQGTKVTQGTEPALAGRSYRIKVEPNTMVRQIVGLDGLRRQLGIKEGAEGTAAYLISEKNIKEYHEREFLLSGVAPGGSAEIMSAVSNVMVKAQAIGKTFEAGPIVPQDESKIVTVKCTGQPLHTLPEGVEQPPQPNDFGRTIVKQMSDMQKYENVGTAVFDIGRGKVISDQSRMDCTLILLGDKIGQMSPGQKKLPKGSGGEMYTVVSRQQNFEVMP